MNKRAVASAIEGVPHFMAYLDAFKATLDQIDLSVTLVQLVDFAPVEALPYLAEQYNVLGVRGYGLCTTDDQRRALIKAAIQLNRIIGTPAAIEQAIIAVGFDNCLVSEGTGIKYNGVYKYNGAKKYGGGKWFNFSVEVFYSGDAPTDTQIALVKALIGVYKNARSVLFDLKFTLTT
jgi:P2-related tail formation protein